MIDQKLVDSLNENCLKWVADCAGLDKNNVFVQHINETTLIDGISLYFRTNHYLATDFFNIYNQLDLKLIGTSKFILGYVYDFLINEKTTVKPDFIALNKMVTDINYEQSLSKIGANLQAKHKIKSTDSLVLKALKHSKNEEFSIFEAHLKKFGELICSGNEEKQKTFNALLEEKIKPEENLNQAKKTNVAIDDTLEKVLEELNSLIGLEGVKNNITELINLLKVQKIRYQSGLENIDTSLHSVFLGPPGTGKTTVARLIGRIYKHLGYLEQGHVVETDRAGMVAGYVGQTALKVDELVKASLNGVLFVDEAYALNPAGADKDFGSEAVDTLLKRMEDYRKNLGVIVAGYTEPMKGFIESNPGLRSRFNRYFMFEHFTPTQLMLIFERNAQKAEFSITPEAKTILEQTFQLLYHNKDEGFGNARVIRNIFEQCVLNQANRMVTYNTTILDETTLKNIGEVDVPNPQETLKQVYMTQQKKVVENSI